MLLFIKQPEVSRPFFFLLLYTVEPEVHPLPSSSLIQLLVARMPSAMKDSMAPAPTPSMQAGLHPQ